MQRVKRRIFSGVVCEQEVYTVSDRANIKKAEPRPRFKDDEERAQHRIGISKRKHQRLVNENFSPLSLYSTLTFDDDSEVHTFSEARRIRDNYFRRLQRACPDAKIIIYMGRGKSTNRIHFHMISDGIPEETISGKWNDGSVIHIRHLREHNYYNGVDYGQDYTGLADYLFNHWTPEQGGHRWKATRNLRQPEKEAPTLALRTYTEKKAPIAPKGYKLVEARATKWGYICRIWLYKVKFAIPDENYTTKGDSIEFTTPEIVGQFIKRSDGLWKAEHVAEPTNSVATAWFTSVREPNNAGG